ncbi:hypothetical protein Vretifemale_3275, partial [Volvox reticuliferus]
DIFYAALLGLKRLLKFTYLNSIILRMAGARAASRGLLAAVFLIFILLQSEASVYSRRRGLKTAGLTEDEINAVMKEHDPRYILHKEKHKEGLKAHPEIQRYLEWRQMHKEGHPDVASAFVGKIPHDYIPHLIEKPVHTEEL